MYTQRQYREALRLFQTVLQLRPDCKPDPRVGIGLCFWALDDKERAKMAWERSVEVVGLLFKRRGVCKGHSLVETHRIPEIRPPTFS